jgi:hypothetical protein
MAKDEKKYKYEEQVSSMVSATNMHHNADAAMITDKMNKMEEGKNEKLSANTPTQTGPDVSGAVEQLVAQYNNLYVTKKPAQTLTTDAYSASSPHSVSKPGRDLLAPGGGVYKDLLTGSISVDGMPLQEYWEEEKAVKAFHQLQRALSQEPDISKTEETRAARVKGKGASVSEYIRFKAVPELQKEWPELGGAIASKANAENPERWESAPIGHVPPPGGPTYFTPPAQLGMSTPKEDPFNAAEKAALDKPTMDTSGLGNSKQSMNFNTDPLEPKLPDSPIEIKAFGGSLQDLNVDKFEHTKLPDGSAITNEGTLYSQPLSDIQAANEFIAFQGGKFAQQAAALTAQFRGDPSALESGLQNLQDTFSQQAPNELAKAEFSRRALDLQNVAYSSSARAQRSNDFKRLHAELNQAIDTSAGEVFLDPSRLQTSLVELRNMGLATLNKGFSQEAVQDKLDKATKKLYTAEINGLLEKNPDIVLEKMYSGEYNFLGSDVAKFTRIAKARMNADSQEINRSLGQQEIDILAGNADFNPLDPRTARAQDRERVFAFNQLGEAAKAIRGGTYGEIQSIFTDSLNPAVKKVASEAMTRMRKDPVSYVEKQKLMTIPTLDGSPASAKSYGDALSAIEELTGTAKEGFVRANPLRTQHLENASKVINSGDPAKIQRLVEYTKQFGDWSQPIIDQINKVNPRFGVLVKSDPKALADTVIGLNANGSVPGLESEESGVSRIRQGFGDNSKFLMQDDPQSLDALHFQAVGNILNKKMDAAAYESIIDKNSGAVMLPSEGGWFGFGNTYKTIAPQGQGQRLTSDETSELLGNLTNTEFLKYGNSSLVPEAEDNTIGNSTPGRALLNRNNPPPEPLLQMVTPQMASTTLADGKPAEINAAKPLQPNQRFVRLGNGDIVRSDTTFGAYQLKSPQPEIDLERAGLSFKDSRGQLRLNEAGVRTYKKLNPEINFEVGDKIATRISESGKKVSVLQLPEDRIPKNTARAENFTDPSRVFASTNRLDGRFENIQMKTFKMRDGTTLNINTARPLGKDQLFVYKDRVLRNAGPMLLPDKDIPIPAGGGFSRNKDGQMVLNKAGYEWFKQSYSSFKGKVGQVAKTRTLEDGRIEHYVDWSSAGSSAKYLKPLIVKDSDIQEAQQIHTKGPVSSVGILDESHPPSRPLSISQKPNRTMPYAADGEPVDFSQVSPKAFQYIPITQGKYALLHKGKPLRTIDGKVYSIDLRKLLIDKGR